MNTTDLTPEERATVYSLITERMDKIIANSFKTPHVIDADKMEEYREDYNTLYSLREKFT